MENVGTIFIDCGVVTLLWTTTFVQIESPTMIYLKRGFIHVLCAVFFFIFVIMVVVSCNVNQVPVTVCQHK